MGGVDGGDGGGEVALLTGFGGEEEVGGFGSFLAISQDPDDASKSAHCLKLLKEEVGPRIKDLTGEPEAALRG